MALHPHLTVPGPARSERFTSPHTVPRPRALLPARQRAEHARHLLEELAQQQERSGDVVARQRAVGLDDGLGISLTFESEPNFALQFESLDVGRSGIELLSVKEGPDGRTRASVFVPDGKLEFFIKRITAYRDEDRPSRVAREAGRPKNQTLVESVSNIRTAALEALWTEVDLPFPASDQSMAWEVWLRRGGDLDHEARLRQFAPNFGLEVRPETLRFLDRTVVLVHGNANQLAESAEILGAIAELRQAKTAADFFTAMTGVEQHARVQGLAGRLVAPAPDAPHVCLLDTGLTRAHPLIAPLTADAKLHCYNPAWGVDDRYGHGTPMAGLALYGDLSEALTTAGPLRATHLLESVKIFNAAAPHEPHLYGAVTQEGAHRAEVAAPRRSRIFCMAVTSPDGRDRGRPSSWSAAVDALAAGQQDGQRRLIILAAGNTDPAERGNYPDSNFTDGLHDPAQAWNAITVAGYTEKVLINATAYPDWTPLASAGDLAPASCTAMTWRGTKWPIKPDIVLEAGNLAQRDGADPDSIDDRLQLLSTNHDFSIRKPLVTFGDTSAAAALAARMAATLNAKYPNFTPETIRALLVHAAHWTPAMLARFTGPEGQIDYNGLVRCFGYGVPTLRELLSSADNSLTLIAQGSIEPFFKEGSTIKTRELKLHPLPWPTEVLQDLGNADVTMRVTLSYFIEPSPGARGWATKFGYQSCGLRFTVKRAAETAQAFERRINRFAREDGFDEQFLQETGSWTFGWNNRTLLSLGSLHSDIWKGRAVDLAARGHIAVYPTFGWWNKRPQFDAWGKTVPYSLIVTIRTAETEVDIYTPVANQIGVPVVIET